MTLTAVNVPNVLCLSAIFAICEDFVNSSFVIEIITMKESTDIYNQVISIKLPVPRVDAEMVFLQESLHDDVSSPYFIHMGKCIAYHL